ncbi:MAG: hydroxymethylbilane synthase [Gammaproteobacteria bacterium]
MIRELRIATRQSRLALWQAEYVADTLRRAHPGIEIEVIPMSTRGDEVLDRSLAKIGGKGLFIKELEVAMLEDRADIAVHSMKDVPWDLPQGMVIGAVLQRADPGDALASVGGIDALDALPENARVGTSSLRRQSQMRFLRPDLTIEPVRGNVETRLRKLDEGEFHAIVLAAAGLKRLGLGERITGRLSYQECLPAVGQGAIGIECREDKQEVLAALKLVEHEGTRRCVDAERSFAATLKASCESPVAAYGEIREGEMYLRGMVATPDGSELLRREVRGSQTDARRLGNDLAKGLLADGAGALLESLQTES